MKALTRRGVLGALAGAGVAVGQRARAQAGTYDINVGAVYPMTGRDATLGQNASMAFRTTLEIVHGDYDLDLPLARTDHLPKLPGARLKFVMADHGGDPARARAEAEKLIATNKIVALMGSADEGVSEALAEVATRAGLPFVDADSSSSQTRQKPAKFVYRFAIDETARVATALDFLGQANGGEPVKSIALLHDKEPEDMRAAQMLRAAAVARNISVAAELPHARDHVEVATNALRQTRVAPEAVVLIGSAADAAGLPNHVSGSAGSFPVICFPAKMADRAIGPLGENAVGLVLLNGFARDARENDPNIAAINTLYRSFAKKDLDELSALQFTAFLTLAFAINESRNASPSAIADKLFAARFPGDRTIMPWEQLSFDAAGNIAGAGVIVSQRQADRFATVFPRGFATAPLRWKA